MRIKGTKCLLDLVTYPSETSVCWRCE